MHCLEENWHGQIYFSFLNNCEEIKFEKKPNEKFTHFDFYNCCRKQAIFVDNLSC